MREEKSPWDTSGTHMREAQRYSRVRWVSISILSPTSTPVETSVASFILVVTPPAGDTFNPRLPSRFSGLTTRQAHIQRERELSVGQTLC